MEPNRAEPGGAPRPGWWSRNWKWVVPAGCLTLLASVAAFVLLLIFLVFGMIKSCDAYKLAVERARQDPRVAAKLGTPIEPRWYVSGSVQISGPNGTASLAIPVSGPRDAATVYVEAVKARGQWQINDLIVEIKSSKERIVLVGPSPELRQ
jgi:hypothetical protein